MKIAFINKYQGKAARGGETFVSELSKRLSKNHEVDILTKISIGKRYDVIIPVNGRLQVFIVRLITFFTGSKMVVSGQSGPGIDDRLNLYSFPDCFVALSEKQLGWAKKINRLIKVVKIPNGVDLERFGAPAKGRKKDGVKTVLSVGAFTKEKRHGLTIQAVAKLDNVNLKIIGSGGERKKEIEGLGKRLLGNKFSIESRPNNQMPEIYREANVFAFPTVPWESFGIAMVEAMASGLPVVASDDPIRREIVGDAGIFVDPNDIDAFARAIRKALDTDWKDKPRKQAEKFDWDKIAKEYENLFKSLI